MKHVDLKEDILSKAEELAQKYHIRIEPKGRLGFVGSAAEFPMVFAEGKTHEECHAATIESLILAVALMLKDDEILPLPTQGEGCTQTDQNK